MAKVITLFLILAAAPLYAYDKVPVEFDWEQIKADGELIAAYEEKNKLKLEWKDSATTGQWYAFWTIHALDVYSTHRGLKYDCIREGNPLLGEKPTLSHMITHKTVFLSPFWMLQNEGVHTKRDINVFNILGATVVYNNFRLLDRAKSKCTKR